MIRRRSLCALRILLACEPVANVAIQFWHLIHHILADPIVQQILLLLRGQFEHLAGGLQFIQHHLVGQSCLPHGDDLVHRHKAVPVQIGRWSGARLLGCRRAGLRSLNGLLRATGIMTRDAVTMRADQIAAASARGAAEQRSKQPVVLAADRCSRHGSAHSPDGSSLLFAAAWQLLATGAAGQQRGEPRARYRFVKNAHTSFRC